MIKKLSRLYPRIFLIDSIGALLTSLLLGIIAFRLEDYFGMPKEVLILLAIIATVFFIYSMSCHLFLQHKRKLFLIVIATANVLYCILTSTLIGLFFQELTILGLIYFIGEILIVLTLVYIEVFIIRTAY